VSVVSVALQFPPLRYFGFTPPLSSFRFCLSSESCNLILKEDEKTCRFCCGYYKISFSLFAFAKVRHEPDPSSTSIKMLLECNLLCYCWRVCNAGWLAGWLAHPNPQFLTKYSLCVLVSDRSEKESSVWLLLLLLHLSLLLHCHV
jgi:hypothetical protein